MVEYPEVLWSSIRGYGFRATSIDAVTWCFSHAEAHARAAVLHPRGSVIDGTPRGQRALEQLYR